MTDTQVVQILLPMPLKEKLKTKGVEYLRFGACLPHEGDGWGRSYLRETMMLCLDEGLIPQLVLPVATLNDHEKKCLDDVLELLERHPISEAVISSWGQLELEIDNTKTASIYLNITNRQELELLNDYGVSTVTVPDNLDNFEQLLQNTPPGIVLECHRQGGHTLFMGWGDRLPDLPYPLKTKQDWPVRTCKRTLHAKPTLTRKAPAGISRWLITVLSEEDWQSLETER